MPYELLRELMVQHFPKPKTEAVVQEITQLLEQEQREQAKNLLYGNSARFDISDSAFLLQFIEKCRKQTDIRSIIQAMSDRFHPDHFALLGELANRMAYDRETGTASTIHYVLGELGYRCHYTGIYTKVCTECKWPCSTKCRECLRLLCPGCANKLLPCLRDKVCFTIGINEKPETTTSFYTEDYYPGAFKPVSLPERIGSIPLEYPDKLVLISLTSRKIVHEFSVCSGECHLAAMNAGCRSRRDHHFPHQTDYRCKDCPSNWQAS